MLDELAKSVAEGQPKSIVIFLAIDEAIDACMVMADVFLRMNLYVTRAGRGLLVEGSEVLFSCVGTYDTDIRGRRGFGEFWDHRTGR